MSKIKLRSIVKAAKYVWWAQYVVERLLEVYINVSKSIFGTPW